MLASAGDDGVVLLWIPSETHHPHVIGDDGLEDKESWRVKHMCRSSGAEIYDLAWSPDAVYFIIGSMDNIGRIYNAQTGTFICIFRSDFSLIAFRPVSSTNRGAQSLRSRRSMGSSKRICCNSILRSLGTHILVEDQGRSFHLGSRCNSSSGSKPCESGPSFSTDLFSQSSAPRSYLTLANIHRFGNSNRLTRTVSPWDADNAHLAYEPAKRYQP